MSEITFIKLLLVYNLPYFHIVHGGLMIFNLDFKGTYHNIRMCLGNALLVYDCLFLHSGHFSVRRAELFLSYFGLKNPLFTFSQHGFSALKQLSY